MKNGQGTGDIMKMQLTTPLTEAQFREQRNQAIIERAARMNKDISVFVIPCQDIVIPMEHKLFIGDGLIQICKGTGRHSGHDYTITVSRYWTAEDLNPAYGGSGSQQIDIEVAGFDQEKIHDEIGYGVRFPRSNNPAIAADLAEFATVHWIDTTLLLNRVRSL